MPMPMAATATFDRAALSSGQSVIMDWICALRPAPMSVATLLFTPDEWNRRWCLIVGVKVDSLVRIRVPAVSSSSYPKCGSEVIRVRHDRECQGSDHDD